MKKFITLTISILFFVACQNQQTNIEEKKNESISIEKQVKGDVYGKSISDNNIISATKITSTLVPNSEKSLKIKGKIHEVCQGSGCWADIEIGNSEIVHITFKNEEFTLPKDIAGKTAVISGIATTEIVSVEMQKRMAMEEGQSQAEINEIKQALIEYYFEAEGVTIIKE